MASSDKTQQRMPTRQRRPSSGAPIVDITGSVGPAGISRPKHRRTFTGFGAGEIKSVEGMFSSLLLWCLGLSFFDAPDLMQGHPVAY